MWQSAEQLRATSAIYRGASVNDANPFAGSMKTIKCRRSDVHNAALDHLVSAILLKLGTFLALLQY